MKRILILLAITLLSLALFTACTSSADTMPQTSPTTSAQPSAMPTMEPAATTDPNISMSPAVTPETGGMSSTNGMTTTQTTDTMNNGGINTIEDARRVSEQIADEVEKLSEISDAEAVVAGNIALVAIEYDAQYQGGLTDRLKDMITERVETIDKAVTSVHVTDSEEMYATIKELGNGLTTAGITFDELQTKLLDLGSTIAGGSAPEVSQPQSNTKGRS